MLLSQSFGNDGPWLLLMQANRAAAGKISTAALENEKVAARAWAMSQEPEYAGREVEVATALAGVLSLPARQQRLDDLVALGTASIPQLQLELAGLRQVAVNASQARLNVPREAISLNNLRLDVSSNTDPSLRVHVWAKDQGKPAYFELRYRNGQLLTFPPVTRDQASRLTDFHYVVSTGPTAGVEPEARIPLPSSAIPYPARGAVDLQVNVTYKAEAGGKGPTSLDGFERALIDYYTNHSGVPRRGEDLRANVLVHRDQSIERLQFHLSSRPSVDGQPGEVVVERMDAYGQRLQGGLRDTFDGNENNVNLLGHTFPKLTFELYVAPGGRPLPNLYEHPRGALVSTEDRPRTQITLFSEALKQRFLAGFNQQTTSALTLPATDVQRTYPQTIDPNQIFTAPVGSKVSDLVSQMIASRKWKHSGTSELGGQPEQVLANVAVQGKDKAVSFFQVRVTSMDWNEKTQPRFPGRATQPQVNVEFFNEDGSRMNALTEIYPFISLKGGNGDKLLDEVLSSGRRVDMTLQNGLAPAQPVQQNPAYTLPSLTFTLPQLKSKGFNYELASHKNHRGIETIDNMKVYELKTVSGLWGMSSDQTTRYQTALEQVSHAIQRSYLRSFPPAVPQGGARE